jgi:RimJ/RimL family protein N-acetyltransferase
MRKLPILKTPRLILRPFKMDDGPVVASLANDKDIATNTENLPFPYEEYMALDWIRAHERMYQENHMLTLAVTHAKKSQVMGAIGLEIEATNNHAELGYWLGKPYWGHGYATEAAKRLIHYGFMDLKYHRIYSIHLSQNPDSGKVLQKIGMTYEGTMRQHIQKWGEFLDVKVYGILRSEYKPGSS